MLVMQESAGLQELRDVDLPLLEVEEQAVRRLAIGRPEGVAPTERVASAARTSWPSRRSSKSMNQVQFPVPERRPSSYMASSLAGSHQAASQRAGSSRS